jgi:hypothetical protein
MFIKVLSGNFKGRGHMGDLNTNGRIILKHIFKKYGVKVGTGLNWLRTGSNGGCKCGNDLCSSLKAGNLSAE